jgi:hypothetical protein
LFENIVRLRRAGRSAPDNRDIAAVRSSLEDELGETMSRRLAADLLGVSHTALGRWVTSGDVPTVYTPSGHIELPVRALLDLYESVEKERQSGQRSRHVLEPSMREARIRASRLKPDDLIDGVAPARDGHERSELRSLAYHRALAQRLRRPMVDEARQLLWKWRAQDRIDPRYADAWDELLGQPVPAIRRAISEDTAQGRDLRQNSPFAGMLSEPERRRILSEIR